MPCELNIWRANDFIKFAQWHLWPKEIKIWNYHINLVTCNIFFVITCIDFMCTIAVLHTTWKLSGIIFHRICQIVTQYKKGSEHEILQICFWANKQATDQQEDCVRQCVNQFHVAMTNLHYINTVFACYAMQKQCFALIPRPIKA